MNWKKRQIAELRQEEKDDMEKRYQVFVSSTYEDLKEERVAVMDCLLDSDCIPVGMEQFPALPVSQWDYIKELIESSDYYLLIVAGRYGSVEGDSGLSYTEKEYKYAIEKGIPILAFLLRDYKALPQEKKETNRELEKKLIGFRKKVENDKRLCNYYDTVDALKYAVSKSIRRTIEQCPGIGWVRGDAVDGDQRDTIERLENRVLYLERLLDGGIPDHKDDLMGESCEILKTVCDKRGDEIVYYSEMLAGPCVWTKNRVLLDYENDIVDGEWIEAIHQLEKAGYLIDVSGKGNVYRVTSRGKEYYYKYLLDGEFNYGFEMDEVDRSIIQIIGDNNGSTRMELSSYLGLSPTTMTRRLTRLREKGVIVLKNPSSKRSKWIIREKQR